MFSEANVRQYAAQGYTLVEGIFTTDELDEMEAEFDGIVMRRLAKRAGTDATWGGEWRDRFKVDMQLIHTHDLQAYSARWAAVLLHDKLTRAFSELMGSPNVQLHHTKLFQKPPERGAAFPMHQDYPYFPHRDHTMMAGIIHLSDATLDMGCLRVYPGSQKLGVLTCAERNHLDQEQWSIEKATPTPAKRGDVVFFNYLTVHGSGINTSDKVRKTVLIQVRDPSDVPLVNTHRSHSQGLIMRGINPLADKPTPDGTLDAEIEAAAAEKAAVR